MICLSVYLQGALNFALMMAQMEGGSPLDYNTITDLFLQVRAHRSAQRPAQCGMAGCDATPRRYVFPGPVHRTCHVPMTRDGCTVRGPRSFRCQKLW